METEEESSDEESRSASIEISADALTANHLFACDLARKPLAMDRLTEFSKQRFFKMRRIGKKDLGLQKIERQRS